jgi:hypothetical protein
MYLLGHVTLGYLLSSVVARWRGQRLVLWAAFTMGLLPDYDLLLRGLGLVHGTYTHSLVILTPTAILLAYFRRESLPYMAALLQHVIGDVLVSEYRVLTPLSESWLGLGLVGMGSMADAAIEVSALLAMLLVMWMGGDLSRLLDGARVNLPVIVPFLSMTVLTWVGGNEGGAPLVEGVQRVVGFGLSSASLALIALGHVVLGALMASSVSISTVMKRSRLLRRE